MVGSSPPLSDLAWSPWVSLQGAGRTGDVSSLPGLYRIRSVETGQILYIGQTGRSLRSRLGSLRGVYGDVMPYNDPHTAAPALWAHRIEFGETFEVSVAELEVERAERMGREALEVTKQRIIYGCSPAYNFGRMPRGWVKSSGNNRRLVEAGRRLRGYRMSDEEVAALPPDESVPPPATLEGDPRSADWLGLAWRSTERDAPGRSDVGVYRIGAGSRGPLDYLGQGLIASRWRSHAESWAGDLAAERSDDSVWGWVPLELGSRQLLEVENDLIASHVVIFARPPVVQFGRSSAPGA
jgi:hypothetical protein